MASLTGSTIVRKTSDETMNNDNTLQDDDDLKIAMAANEVWYFEAMLTHIAASSGTPDIKIAFTVPSGATLIWSGIGLGVSGAANVETEIVSGTAAAFGGGGDSHTIQVKGIVIMSTTAGDLQLQWAQNTATAEDTDMKAGSWLLGAKEA